MRESPYRHREPRSRVLEIVDELKAMDLTGNQRALLLAAVRKQHSACTKCGGYPLAHPKWSWFWQVLIATCGHCGFRWHMPGLDDSNG